MTLAIDGTAVTGVGSGSSVALSGLTTTNANDVVIVYAIDSDGGTLTCTSAHLTFTQRASVGTANQWTWEFYAVSTTALSSEVITVHCSTNSSYVGACAFAVSGANTSAPFDTNGSLPVTGTTAPKNVSSTSATGMVIAGFRQGTVTSPAAASGYTLVNGSGYLCSEYKTFTTALSSASVGDGSNSDVNGAIVDVLVPPSAGGGSGVNVITINPVANPPVSTAFTVSGTWQAPPVAASTIAAPSMTTKDGSGSAAAFPGTPTLPGAVTIPVFTPPAENWAYSHPGISSTGNTTVTIADGSGVTASVVVNVVAATGAKLNEVIAGSANTLMLSNGDVLSISSGNAISLNGTVVAGGSIFEAVGVNVVTDTVIWGQKVSDNNWYTHPDATTGTTWTLASPQPTIVGGGAVTINGVTLNGSSFTADSAVSTVIGSLMVQTSGGPFTGTLAMGSGHDSAKFKIAGGNQLEVNNATIAAGSYTADIVPTMGGATNSGNTYTVSVTATAATTGIPEVLKGSGNTITMNNGHLLACDASGNITDNGNPLPDGGGSSAAAYDATSNTIYGQDSGSGNWYRFTGTTFVIASPQPQIGTSSPPPPPPPPPPPGPGFTVTAAGFVDPRGRPWRAKGVNGAPQDLLAAWDHMVADLPGLQFLRIVADSTPGEQTGNTDANTALVVQKASALGIVCEIADFADGHSSGPHSPNTAWYMSMVDTYKNNPLVFLETPNEPTDVTPGSVISDQIALINAIRARGWTNPIGLMGYAGYEPNLNLSAVVASVGTSQIYGTMHFYNFDAASIDAHVSATTSLGIWPVIDEFGGWVGIGPAPDANAVPTITDVINNEQAGKCGAAFWYIYNPEPSDSVYTTAAGGTLTSPWGDTYVAPWLAGTRMSEP